MTEPPLVVWFDLELEPCPAGHLHLRDEPEQSILFEALDPPEVDRVADLYADGVTAAAPQARAADEHVEGAAQLPELVAEVPARVTADSLNRSERRRGRARHRDAARVDEPGAVARPAVSSAGCGRLIRPAGLRDLLVLVRKRPCDRVSRAPRAYGEHLERSRVVDDCLVAQAVDELTPHPGVHRRDEMKPETRQPWRQHRNRHHLSPQTTLLGVLVHQVEVGTDVSAADLEHLASVRLVVESLQQVRDHVLDRDRLCARLHPARRDHHGQPLDERPQHLERRTPRADHDR